MIGGIVSAIGKAAGSIAKPAARMGETMEGAASFAPKIEAVVKPAIEVAKPKPSIFNFAKGLETQGHTGPAGVKKALTDLAVTDTKNIEKSEEADEGELSDVDKLRKELEEQRKKDRRRETMSDLANALKPPEYGPAPKAQGIVSKTLEEVPEAIGEKPDNLPREAP